MLKKITTVLLAIIFGQEGFGQSSYDEKLTTASNVRLTINNLGMIGNAFKGSYDDINLRYPSCEYPAGSRIDHLFQGGLWIGAKVGDNTIVSTGAVSSSGGYSAGASGYEFTANQGSSIRVRSNLLDNTQFYTPEAVSHQDFVSDFTDKNIKIPGTDILINNLESGPLGADVHFEAYNWGFGFANFFVILNFKIKNSSNQPWENVHIGYWSDPVIRNTLRTPAGSGGTSYFNKGGSGYVDSLYMSYEFDAAGDVGYTDSYFGCRYLGSQFKDQFIHSKIDTSFKTYYNVWQFGDFTSINRVPANDLERFARLSKGMNQLPPADFEALLQNLKKPGNLSMLLSAGPYPTIQPGEEVNVAFAIILAEKTQDGKPTSEDNPAQKTQFLKNAGWAQSAFNGEDRNFNGKLDEGEDNNGNNRLDRYILPEPPPPPNDTILLEENKITLYWQDNAESFIDPISRVQDFEGYRLYKTRPGFDTRSTGQNVFQDLELIAHYDLPKHTGYQDSRIIEADNGFNTIRLAEPLILNNKKYNYKYEITNILQGWQHGVVVTAFDRGEPANNLGPLESSPLTRLKRTFPGTKPNNNFTSGEPFVYPNPYYAGASWEGKSPAEEDRRIIFANLPAQAEVSVYTVSGDLVYQFEHRTTDVNQSTRWNATYAQVSENQKRVFSGGEHAWNLLSTNSQIIARGLYFFTVKDLDSGESRTGKFVIIK